MAQLTLVYLFVAVPLVYLGAAYGFAKPAIEFPTKPTRAARAIPPQPWALRFVPAALACGVVPFGASFVQLYFVLDSVWMENYYMLFGFSAAAFGLLARSPGAPSHHGSQSVGEA